MFLELLLIWNIQYAVISERVVTIPIVECVMFQNDEVVVEEPEQTLECVDWQLGYTYNTISMPNIKTAYFWSMVW